MFLKKTMGVLAKFLFIILPPLKFIRSGKVPDHWKPCGEGENICNCKKATECGYIEFYKGIARLGAEGNFR